MAFTPSMSPALIVALDRSRQQGNTSPYTVAVEASKKEPWKCPSPTNKLDEEYTTYYDAEPENTKQETPLESPDTQEETPLETSEDNNDTEDDQEESTDEPETDEEDDPMMDKGLRLAINMLKGIPKGPMFGKPLPPHKEGGSKQDYASKLIEHNANQGYPQKQAIAIGMSEAGMSKPTKKSAADDCDGHERCTPQECKDTEGSGICLRFAEKALTSRSMYIPRPLHNYDPFNIERSATSAITRANSKIYGPDGVAPLVGETINEVQGRRHDQDLVSYKSCAVHGITYKANKNCYPCQLAKSTTCQKCGETLVKQYGGLVCPKHGDKNAAY